MHARADQSRPRAATLALRAAPLALVALLAACPTPPEVLPPPFGPDASNPDPNPRLFFPTGLQAAPSGHLLVVNGNFDRGFDAGLLVSLDPVWLQGVFAGPSVTSTDPKLSVPIPRTAFTGLALIGNYAGPLGLSEDGTVAITGSRDSGILNAVKLDPATGALSCAPGAAGERDCRAGAVNLGTAAELEGPYGIANGFFRLPGTTADVKAMFVSGITAHIDQIVSGQLYARGRFAALDPADPSKVLFAGNTSTATIAGGIGGGPLVFHAQRRQLIHAGCYQRYPNSTTGVPSTGKCGGTNTSNLLRFISVDEGELDDIRLVDISSDVRSNDTTSLVLGNEDPATGVPRTLYAAVRSPDLLVELDLPTDPTITPTVRRATPVPVTPFSAFRVQRPAGKPGADLIVLTASGNGTLDVFDSASGQVVARVDKLGNLPYAIAQLPPKPGDAAARLVITVFGECRLAAVEVPFDQPWRASLKARLGSCP